MNMLLLGRAGIFTLQLLISAVQSTVHCATWLELFACNTCVSRERERSPFFTNYLIAWALFCLSSPLCDAVHRIREVLCARVGPPQHHDRQVIGLCGDTA